MMKILFSPSTFGFYDELLTLDYEKSGSWPEDLVEITNELHLKFCGPAPAGKRLGSENGMPAWADVPPPTAGQLRADAKKVNLKKAADSEISWRQDAVDADIATNAETDSLAAWKKYRMLLMRVETSNLDWPEQPA